ncbi:MAG: hypothetical protein V3V97_12800, partial [Hyphomicrobiaceae bacterium]
FPKCAIDLVHERADEIAESGTLVGLDKGFGRHAGHELLAAQARLFAFSEVDTHLVKLHAGLIVPHQVSRNLLDEAVEFGGGAPIAVYTVTFSPPCLLTRGAVGSLATLAGADGRLSGTVRDVGACPCARFWLGALLSIGISRSRLVAVRASRVRSDEANEPAGGLGLMLPATLGHGPRVGALWTLAGTGRAEACRFAVS